MKSCVVLFLAVGVTAFGQTNEIETYRTGLFLPANERWSFYSNFVERDCLNENDRAEIRRAIEKKEEKENR